MGTKTVVLDDDPTGTQSATGVTVLFSATAANLTAALREADSVYVQTNSRALPEGEAVALAEGIRQHIRAAEQSLGALIQVVLRGDSTLRGHVFAESAVFESADSVLLFVPAFPDGGRITIDGVHAVDVGDGKLVPAAETEYAQDPVFPFRASRLADYVAEKTGRPAVGIARHRLDADVVANVLASAAERAVVVPDAGSAADIRTIAEGVRRARARGLDVVVRCAAPLAAELAGVASAGLLRRPLAPGTLPVLVVCGSHTSGATAQLASVTAAGANPIFVDTDAALLDADREGVDIASRARTALESSPVVVVASQRERRPEHNTLAHGERVMAALVSSVGRLLSDVRLVVTKGGITSADVASRGIGAESAYVLGQVLPGVSAWRLRDRLGRELLYVIVPGNVGGPQTIVDAIQAAVGSQILSTAGIAPRRTDAERRAHLTW